MAAEDELSLTFDHCADQFTLVDEVVVDLRLADTGRFADAIDRGTGHAVLEHQLGRGVHDLGSGPLAFRRQRAVVGGLGHGSSWFWTRYYIQPSLERIQAEPAGEKGSTRQTHKRDTTMAVFTRGFTGHRPEPDDNLPPGQHLTEGFPVLSAGPTPRIDTADWNFSIQTESGKTHTWNWDELRALPIEDITTDIHCVTSWSKIGTHWRGVSLDTLFAGIETKYEYVMAHSYGGYTTNLQMEEILGGRAWVAFEYDGDDLAAEHGGPARLLVPHLYFWKSAKWVRGLVMQQHDDPGFWEENGYNLHGDPWREERYS